MICVKLSNSSIPDETSTGSFRVSCAVMRTGADELFIKMTALLASGGI